MFPNQLFYHKLFFARPAASPSHCLPAAAVLSVSPVGVGGLRKAKAMGLLRRVSRPELSLLRRDRTGQPGAEEREYESRSLVRKWTKTGPAEAAYSADEAALSLSFSLDP